MSDPTVLLVEDDPDDAELTSRALRRCGLTQHVVIAGDGVEALAYLFGSGTSAVGSPTMPGLVLVDLKLPRMDGFTLLSRLRSDQRTRLLPVVILSSSIEEEDVVRSYELGANSYVRKPVDYVGFREAARQIGAYWLGINEPAPRPFVRKARPCAGP